MTCGVSRLMECDAKMTRLLHYPCCCGGLRWTVTQGCCGCEITEEFCRGDNGIGGDAAWPGAKMVDGPGVVHLMDLKTLRNGI